jgi:ribosome-associated translation inhibitor RaiA
MIDALRAYASRRLSFATRRFERRIRHVMVRLADLNGPKRGVDSRCSISVDLTDGRHLFVHATAPWPFASLTKAASRLNTALRREFDRSGWQRRNLTLHNDPEVA